MTIHSSLAILLLLPAAMALEVQAQTVNKWVDDEGVVGVCYRQLELPNGLLRDST